MFCLREKLQLYMALNAARAWKVRFITQYVFIDSISNYGKKGFWSVCARIVQLLGKRKINIAEITSSLWGPPVLLIKCSFFSSQINWKTILLILLYRGNGWRAHFMIFVNLWNIWNIDREIDDRQIDRQTKCYILYYRNPRVFLRRSWTFCLFFSAFTNGQDSVQDQQLIDLHSAPFQCYISHFTHLHTEAG